MNGFTNIKVAGNARIQTYKLTGDVSLTGNGQLGLSLSTGVDPTADNLGIPELIEGMLYWHKVDQKWRTRLASSWTDLAAVSGGDTLDSAYNGGASITVDAGAVTLAGSHATNNQLAITSTHATASGNAINVTVSGASATGNAIDVNVTGATSALHGVDVNISQAGATGHALNLANAGTGKLINSTNFTVTPAGAIVGASATLSGAVSAATGAFTGAVTVGSNLTVSGNLSVTGSFTLPATTIANNVALTFGTTGVTAFKGNGTSLFLYSAADDTIFSMGNDGVVGTKRLDVTMYGATNAAHLKLDASGNTYTNTGIQHILADNTALAFGDAGAELSIKSNATGAYITNTVHDTVLYFGNDGVVSTTRMDVVLYGATSAANLTLDASANKLTNTGIAWKSGDNVPISIGDADDVVQKWDGTDYLITAAAADATIIKIGTAANAIDLWLAGAGTATVKFDSSAKTLTFDDVDLYLGDNDVVALGDAQDVTAVWNATDLIVDCAAANTVIKIGQTNIMDLWLKGTSGTIKYDASADLLTLASTTIAFATATPANAADAGVAGTITYDANYFYVCLASGNWHRTAHATW